MPGRDGTGPMGISSGRGGGLGMCNSPKAGHGAGMGLMLDLGCYAAVGVGRRLGKERRSSQKTSLSNEKQLEMQKEILENPLLAVTTKLQNL